MKGGAPERAQAGRVDGVGRHECRSHADDAPVWVPRAACRLGVSSDREYAEVQQGGAEDNAEHQAADGTEIGGCTMVCHVLVNTPGRCGVVSSPSLGRAAGAEYHRISEKIIAGYRQNSRKKYRPGGASVGVRRGHRGRYGNPFSRGWPGG